MNVLEIEPLRSVGVALSQNTLQELANSLGIERRVAEMAEAEKAQLRYIQILKSTTQWQGDMGRTLIAPANSIRVLQEQFKLLGRAIGRAFLPILMEVLPYIVALTQLITELGNTIAEFLGYEITDIDYSSLETGNTVIENIGTSAEETTKKLNTMLAPFDELNVVQNKSASTGIGSSLGSDLGLDLPEYDALAGLTDEFSNKVASAKKELTDLFEVIKPIAITLGTMWAIQKVVDFTTAIGKLFGILEKDTSISLLGLALGKIGKTLKSLAELIPAFSTKLISSGLGLISSGLGILAGDSAMEKLLTGEGNEDNNIFSVQAGTALSMGGGALSGAAIGSAILPGVGTAIGILVGGLAGAIGMQQSLADTVEATKINYLELEKESTAAIKNITKDLNEQYDLIKQNAEKDMATSIVYSNYVSELEKIVEANGSVKKGYEGRVSFIINELNEAYGTEIKIVNGVIQEYDKQKKKIKELIAEQKNQIALNMAAEQYELARKNKASLEQQMLVLEREIKQLELEGASAELIAEKRKQYDLLNDSYEQGAKAFLNYEGLTKAILEGDADAIAKYTKEVEKNYITGDDSIINTIDKAIISYDKLMNVAKDSGIETSNEVRDVALADLRLASDELVSYSKTTDDITGNIMTAWFKLGNSSTEAFSEAFSKLDKQVQDEIINKMKDRGYNISKNLQTGLWQLEPIAEIKITAKDDGVASTLDRIANNIKQKFNINSIFGETAGIVGEVLKNITFRADGGFPKTGEFFVARESGPELVGRIGTKSAVANNEQIATVLTNAVIAGLSGISFGNNGKGVTVININGRKVYEGMGEYVDSENDRYGTNYVHV